MADNVSSKRRSEIMSNVRSKNTQPELIVRKFLFNNGLRYRLHDKALPGKPDIKLPMYNSVIFVNGCFWHGHQDCKVYVMPKANERFWSNKIDANKRRDQSKAKALTELGWHVYTIWGCDLKATKREVTLQRLLAKLRQHI